MISVSRLDGKEFFINADLIETIERTPDTVVSLINGKKFVVREAAEEIVGRIMEYKGRVSGVVRSQRLEE